MSIRVELDELKAVAAGQTPYAYLLTVSDGEVTCEAGNRSCANAAARPSVSLLWPPATTGDYSLIVDGDARVDGSTVRIAPARAVRHRPAPGGGSDCAPVELG